MSYTSQPALRQWINWPSTAVQQWEKNQTTRTRHVDGTPWDEQPYVVKTSYFSGLKKYGTLSYTPRACNGNTSQDVNGRVLLDYYSLEPRASNRARSRFVEALHESQTASIGTALGEWRSTLAMIAGRAKQLYFAAQAVKRRDIYGAARALGVPLNRGKSAHADLFKWRDRVGSVAGLWLEYSFGWRPLITDVIEGCRVISSPIHPDREKVISRATAFALQERTLSYTSGGGVHNEIYISGRFESRVEIRGEPELINPNLELADRVGLINPALVAWNLIPFSFLVDQVVDVGKFLASYSDAIAWNVNTKSISYDRRCLNGKTEEHKNVGGSQSQRYGGTYDTAVGLYFRRDTTVSGLPPYVLEFTSPLERLGVGPAANYIALLAQTLQGFKSPVSYPHKDWP
jgi:hypothetical protein